jgi:hypothetical protein
MSSERTRLENPGSLPEIIGVEAMRMRYSQPRVYYAERERREAREAIEIIIRTSHEFPMTNLSPALFVGDVPLIEYEGAGPSLYRFFAFDFEKLRAGDPVSLGWLHSFETKRRSDFRYEVKGHREGGPPLPATDIR